MSIYINTYQPISSTRFGRKALLKYPTIHALEDGSIRREPDFKHRYPGISGLCRPGSMKSINLSLEDIIVYKTTRTHILTSILRIIKSFEDHSEAQHWYNSRKMRTPTNCIHVRHLDVEKSHAKGFSDEIKDLSRFKRKIERKWDTIYKHRAQNVKSSYFFITEPIYNAVQLNLKPKDYINIEELLRIHFKRKLPETLKRPERITENCYNDLLSLIR